MAVKNNRTGIALIAKDISYIKEEVTEIKAKMEKDYVTRHEFEPIQKIVYGLVALILVSVIGAVIAMVLRT